MRRVRERLVVFGFALSIVAVIVAISFAAGYVIGKLLL